MEFTCPECASEFVAEWTFGDDVTCSHCGAVWETDWDTDDEDNVCGPWIAGRMVQG